MTVLWVLISPPTTFYDGQGMMVRKDSGLTTLEDFEDSTICVQAGTTTEKNLADTLRQLGINAESVVFPDTPSTTQAYDEGRCDGLSSGNLQEVEVSLLDKAEDVWRLYQNDELDCIYLTPIFSPGRLEHARQRCPDQYLSGPTPSNIFLVLDITRPPFNNLFVRQALAMAIDKETLANVTLTGLYPPATGGFVLPGMPGHVTGIGYSHNLKQARELLAHVGYPGGRGFPTVIARVLDANIYRIISRALHIMWQENLEINIEFEPMSPEIRGHIYLTGTAPDYLDPDTFLRVNNWSPETGWQHPAFDRLVEQARRIADQEERLAMYRQAEEILSEQAVLLPLLYGRFHMMLKPWLLKYPVSPMFVPYWKDAILETH